MATTSTSSWGNPRITIVTPSFNQAAFIEQTIRSVLGQGYDDLEYLVFDGGSTDGTVDILKRYDGRITYWQSERDDGQAAAVNAGFARATGDIIGWINSDDFYLPGALATAAARLDPSRPSLLAGNCMHMNEETGAVHGSDVPGRSRQMDLRLADYLIQPATFWTAAAWKAVGPLVDSLHYAFDWEWFVRAWQAGVEIETTPAYLSVYRIHAQHKSGSGGERRSAELREIYRRHVGEPHAELFDALSRNAAVRRTFALMRRAHADAWFPRAARAIWPRLFGRFSEDEIRDVAAMAMG